MPLVDKIIYNSTQFNLIQFNLFRKVTVHFNYIYKGYNYVGLAMKVAKTCEVDRSYRNTKYYKHTLITTLMSRFFHTLKSLKYGNHFFTKISLNISPFCQHFQIYRVLNWRTP